MTQENNRLATVATIIFLGAVAVAGFNIQPMYLGALADHLAFTAEQIGMIAGLEVGGSALAGIVATFWIRRWDWRQVAFFALLALAIGNISSIYATNFETLALIRFLTGFLGIGTNYALAIAALSDTHRVDRNFSIAVVVQVSVAILGFILLPPYIESLGTQAVFLPLALLAVATLPLLRFLPRGGGVQKATMASTKHASNLPIWLALGCQFVWYLGVGGVWAFVERIGNEAGFDAEGIGNALAIGMAVGLLGAFAAAFVADRFGRIIPFTVAMLGQVVAVWLLADLQELSGLIIAICIYNSTWNFALPYIFALAALADTRGQLVVLMSTAQTIGITLGATLAGVIIGKIGLIAVLYQGGGAAIAAIAVFASVAVMLRRRRE